MFFRLRDKWQKSASQSRMQMQKWYMLVERKNGNREVRESVSDEFRRSKNNDEFSQFGDDIIAERESDMQPTSGRARTL